ncbi:hypothetical protein NKR19_g895 [Coniochaeta hoffmannii]|uniref:Uncharacterized protein n=1 Tax=Coniochaeta hoffmannii TaxID=91930 RepID=A0AA38SJC2_9PEZI|nr:hypothetical protein NKR19_g895 [Coniochaeta hoffmannii]
MAFKFDDQQCDFCSSRSEKTVNTENYSAARPPHLNKSNESSQQVAGTTAALPDLDLAAAIHTQVHMGGDKDEREPNYPIDHKPPSNMSNVTASTDATAVANVDTSKVDFTTPPYNFASNGLTESVLARHQHELQLLNPGDFVAWLEGAAPGYTHLAVTHHKKGRGRHAPRSKPSQASDTSYVHVAPPTSEAGQSLDILAAGALFDEQSFNPYFYNSRLDMSCGY